MKNFLVIVITLLALALGVGWPTRGARVLTASAQQQPGTTVSGTCDCDGFKVTATRVVNSNGSCTYTIKIAQTYQTTGPVHVPKGIRLTAVAPVTFQSAVGTASMLQSPALVTPGTTTVQWSSPTPLPNNAPPQALATVTVNPNGVSPQQLILSWLDEDGVTMCRATLNLECPCRTAEAKPNQPTICSGQTTTVALSPAPPSGSQVTWWKAQAVGGQCPPPIVPGSPTPLGWTVAQVGGNTCNTNVLTQTTCYQAVITEGQSCTYTSGVATVKVGQVANLGNVTQTPASLQFCKTGSAAFTVNDPYLAANPQLVSWQDPGGNTVGAGLNFTTPQLTATGAADCPFRVYQYKLTVADSGCGAQTRLFPITVFHEPAAAAPVANPPGPLCYDQATRINLPVTCGTVSQWEKSTVGPAGPWSPVAGAGSTVNYWTPELLQTTWYHAKVGNGVCPDYVTQALQVGVKPQLAVSLTANATTLCQGAVTLTAHPPAGYPTPLTYRWYRNGTLVTTTAVPTLTITQPGNWRVVVSDPSCGTAKSNVVRIYPRPVLVVRGPCGVCNGGSVTLKADIVGGDPSCPYTFNWTSSAGGGSLGTGQTLTVSPTLAPGASVTYTVTANCSGCTVSAQHTVTRCPP